MNMRRDVFQAITNPTRREILGLLINNSMNLTSVTENFEISQPAILKHIKILLECGVITIEKEGRERICSLEAQKLTEVADWLEPFRQLWEGRFKHLDMLLESMKSKPKNKRS